MVVTLNNCKNRINTLKLRLINQITFGMTPRVVRLNNSLSSLSYFTIRFGGVFSCSNEYQRTKQCSKIFIIHVFLAGGTHDSQLYRDSAQVWELRVPWNTKAAWWWRHNYDSHGCHVTGSTSWCQQCNQRKNISETNHRLFEWLNNYFKTDEQTEVGWWS